MPVCSLVNKSVADFHLNLKVLLVSSTDGDLLTSSSLRGICHFVEQLISPMFPYQQRPNTMSIELTSTSIAENLAELRKKTCSQLDDNDVSYAKQLLEECVSYYKNGTLKSTSEHPESAYAVGTPRQCYEANFVYNVMHYFADVDFYNTTHDLMHTAVYMSFLPSGYPFYRDHIQAKILDNGIVRLEAIGFPYHLSVKIQAFQNKLIGDLKYFGVAIVFIGVFTLIYLLSFVLVVVIFVNIALSFGLALFLYYYMCQMVFFPFINLIALLLLIAVSADDVFIFYDTWLQVTDEYPEWSRDQRLSASFTHAILSIFVTSLTTAAAFAANLVSHITAIQCFGVFAALSMTTNLVMMTTITPAVICAMEAYAPNFKCPPNVLFESIELAYFTVAAHLKYVIVIAIPLAVQRAWWAFIAVGLIVGVGASVVVFYKPGLVPPTSIDFQLFTNKNPLEKWDLYFKYRFPAAVENNKKGTPIPVTYVFGFIPTDVGNTMDPNDGDMYKWVDEPYLSEVSLLQDGAFDWGETKTQEWLRSFCEAIQAEQMFNVSASRPCIVSSEDLNKVLITLLCKHLHTSNATAEWNQCCTQKDYQRQCIQKARQDGNLALFKEYRDFVGNMRYTTTGCPLYDKTDGHVVGYQISALTTFTCVVSYIEMHATHTTLSNFLEKHLESAPDGLRSGFFSGNGLFNFYDLQHSLTFGTYHSVGLSLGASLVVLLFTVRNALITIYAMVTIMISITSTVATIVLLGWKLNVIVSLTITLAVGMSIDFTIHYGVVYQLSRDPTSAGRTYTSFQRVGSAVAAAAWTSFSAGIAVLNCQLEPYRRLGVFLVLVMVFSWTCSTFFFQSLCHIIGPVNNIGQLRCPAAVNEKCKRSTNSTEHNGSEDTNCWSHH